MTMGTSSSSTAVRTKFIRMTADTTAQGKKYGNSAQKRPENRVGNRSCGRDKIPPMTGLWSLSEKASMSSESAYPIEAPMAHMTGINANP